MMAKKKIIGLTVLVATALLFMAWLAGLLHFGKIAPGLVAEKAAAPAGRVLVISETMIPRELEVLGEVISPSLAQVSAQVPGRVSKIWVEAGTRVPAGAPLVTLSAEEYQARLNQARAGVTQAQAQLTQASADYQRYQYLLKEGAASPREFEAVEARFKSAQAALSCGPGPGPGSRYPEGLHRYPGARGRGGGGPESGGGRPGPAGAAPAVPL